MAKRTTQMAEQARQTSASTTSLQPVEDLARAVAEDANECLERLSNIADLLFGVLPEDPHGMECRPTSCFVECTMCSLDAAYKNIHSMQAVIDRFEG